MNNMLALMNALAGDSHDDEPTELTYEPWNGRDDILVARHASPDVVGFLSDAGKTSAFVADLENARCGCAAYTARCVWMGAGPAPVIDASPWIAWLPSLRHLLRGHGRWSKVNAPS